RSATTPEERGGLERSLEAGLAAIRSALREYRAIRSAFWPFERIAHQNVREAMRTADEYMSLFLEERLAMLAAALDGSPGARDGSGFVVRARLRISALAQEEAHYRQRYGYVTLTHDRLGAGEYFTYRSSLLKKAVQQALYLDPRATEGDTFLRNAVGA